MHGLFNRSIQCFLRDTYGLALWQGVTSDAGLGFDNFEPMLQYDVVLTARVIDAAAIRLGRPRETVLEDLGTYLVSHPTLESVRRLLRFGGVTFTDFLNSLEDLPGRCRLALPELAPPTLVLAEGEDGFVLTCRWSFDGFGHVVMGLLRAMADDYGALAFLEHLGEDSGQEVIAIRVAESHLFEGRRFDLAARAS